MSGASGGVRVLGVYWGLVGSVDTHRPEGV